MDKKRDDNKKPDVDLACTCDARGSMICPKHPPQGRGLYVCVACGRVSDCPCTCRRG